MDRAATDSPTVPARSRAWLAAALALALAVLLLYGRTRTHGFVAYDDPVYVSENEMVARGLSWKGLAWSFGFHAGNWHPLTWLAHMLDVELFGLDAGAHHLANAALHALNALLLALALARLTGSPWTSLAVAALFALHPLRVESVAWASEKKDLLAGTFCFLTLLAHGRYARHGGAGRYALVLLALALGLMAKSMLVTLPVLLLVLDAWPLGRWRASRGDRATGSRLLAEKLPHCALALGAGVATLWIQRAEGAVGTLGSLTLLERASNAFRSYWIYAWKTLWPRDLACFVPHPVVVTPRDELASALYLPGALAFLGLVAVTLLAWRARVRHPHLLFGWAWFLVCAAPVIGFLQVGQQAYADRYTYLPTLGLLIAVLFELRRLAREKRARQWAFGLLVLGWCAALLGPSRRQIDTWRDSRTLFEHAFRTVPRNYLAATFLGEAERRRGELGAARAHLETALEANKFHLPAMLELGLTLAEMGELTEARKTLKRALRHDPANAQAQGALADVQRRLESTEGAAPE
jgi:tetratricopeptide (TPR) repeat protein